ncbi:Chromosomal replication initiator protein DnaA [Bythopirellula polymerisocia]|uniref:Chromosomal replication initiator protein DnaA n=2 Tax=Bythopirellula polymerisocia TaxID=2528003 RepID=A0A5C6D241_9BACT|nr:Chromosomal replication initiator protein DnaA [Bythopirellula polymerisocia]
MAGELISLPVGIPKTAYPDGAMQVDEVLRIDLPPVETGAGITLGESFAGDTLGQGNCFVAGPENRLPILALEHLLTGETDFDSNNWASPLVLVGPAGSGKSLLVRGIVRRWQPLLGEDCLAYLSAIDFARTLQTARSEGDLASFRIRLRTLKLLVLEDIHKLPPAIAIQHELRDLLDIYDESGATILCTSRVPPTAQQQLESGLRDRLAGSLVLWLNHPGTEARLELLKLVAVERETTINERQLRTLAESVTGPADHLLRSLREWEVAPQVGANPANCRTPPSAKEVVAVVARYFNLTQAALKGPARRKTLVFARAIVVYLLRTLTPISYVDIGRALGNRDHTTIMHAMTSIQKSLARDSQTQTILEDLRRILLAV